jgi:hypothetical protein
VAFGGNTKTSKVNGQRLRYCGCYRIVLSILFFATIFSAIAGWCTRASLRLVGAILPSAPLEVQLLLAALDAFALVEGCLPLASASATWPGLFVDIDACGHNESPRSVTLASAVDLVPREQQLALALGLVVA